MHFLVELYLVSLVGFKFENIVELYFNELRENTLLLGQVEVSSDLIHSMNTEVNRVAGDVLLEKIGDHP
jgi:hypothetical protein